jgi:hypothetical protein
MNSGLAKGPHHCPIEASELAGINRSPARSPDWCGIASLSFRLCGLANPLGPPEVKTRTLLVETRPTSAQIVVTGRSIERHANPSQLKKESDHGE